MPTLNIDNVHTYYGNIHALKGISLNIEKGEIVTLIGGNGAGKTTTLRTISGLLKPREGNLSLDGEDLLKYKAHEIVYKGISMVPEGRGVFARLTVLENLEMGAFTRILESFLSSLPPSLTPTDDPVSFTGTSITTGLSAITSRKSTCIILSDTG